jgi:hypothetical protein
MTGKNRPDAALLKAVMILTTSSFPTLQVRARARMDDGSYYHLQPEDLSHAVDIALGEQADAEARQLGDEITKRIVIYFTPTSIFENPPMEILAASS